MSLPACLQKPQTRGFRATSVVLRTRKKSAEKNKPPKKPWSYLGPTSPTPKSRRDLPSMALLGTILKQRIVALSTQLSREVFRKRRLSTKKPKKKKKHENSHQA
jgi:hypothetical protein